LRRRLKIFFFSFSVIVLAGTIIGLNSTQVYRVTTTLAIERPLIDDEGGLFNEDNEIKNLSILVKSPSLLVESVVAAGLASETARQITVCAVRKNESNLLEVSMDAPQAGRLEVVLKKFLEVLANKVNNLETRKLIAKVDFIKSQIRIIEEEIKNTDKSLQQYIEKEEVLSIAEKLGKLNEELQRLRDERINLEMEQKMIAESVKDFKKKSIEYASAYGIEDTTSQELLELRTNLFQLERERIKLLSTYQEGHPEVLGVDNQISFVKSRIEKKSSRLKNSAKIVDRSGQIGLFIFQRLIDLETQQKNLIQKINQTNVNLEAKTKQFKHLSTILEEFNTLTRRLKVNEEIHSNLIKKLNQAEIDRATKTVSLKIPTEPTEPRSVGRMDFKLIMLVSILLAFFGGLAFANLQESMDFSLKSPEDAQELLRLQTLGEIPDLKMVLNNPGDPKISISPMVFTFHQRNSLESEAFRSLRAALIHISKKKPFRTLLLSSGGAGIGKTTVLVNLAMVYAQAGAKVIIVDCDLRKPAIHHYFFLSNHFGLSDTIMGEDLEKIIQPTAHEKIQVVASGPLPPNPPELLGSKNMSYIIERLVSMADMVFFDAPPLLGVSDTLVLSGKMDAVLFLAPLNRGSARLSLRALEQLRLVEAPLLGMVNNFLQSEDYDGFHYNYRRFSRR